MRMREEARRQAAQSQTGLLSTQSAASAMSRDDMGGAAIARASPLFQGSQNQQRKRRVRPYEPYIPPVRKTSHQQLGLATRLLGASQASSSEALEDNVQQQDVPHSLRCLSEPCSVVMAKAPEQTAAAQYVHVRPVCQHAAWNLTVSSVLGQHSKDHLTKIVKAVHSTLGVDGSEAATSDADPEASGSRSTASSSHSTEISISSKGRGNRSRDAKGRAQNSQSSNTGNEDATVHLATKAGAKKWASWKQAVGAAQAMYAQQFIEVHGHPPQVLPKKNMPQLRAQQSTHQDSEVVEHMLNAYYESRSWQQAQSAAEAVLDRRVCEEHATQEASCELDTLDTHENTEQYEEHSMSVWESANHQEELEHDSGELQGERWDDQQLDTLHTGGMAPLPRSQSLDLNKLDMLWSQATATRSPSLDSEEGSAAPLLLEHSSTDAESSDATEEDVGHSSEQFVGEWEQQKTVDSLVPPPEWGLFQPPVQQLEEVHGSDAFDEQMHKESTASSMHISSTAHDKPIVDDHDEYIDDGVYDDDEAVFDDEEYSQVLHGIAIADDPLDLDRMVGNLPPSIDGMGMLPHDLGFDGLHGSYSATVEPGQLGGDEYRLGGAQYGGVQSRRSFNFLR